MVLAKDQTEHLLKFGYLPAAQAGLHREPCPSQSFGGQCTWPHIRHIRHRMPLTIEYRAFHHVRHPSSVSRPPAIRTADRVTSGHGRRVVTPMLGGRSPTAPPVASVDGPHSGHLTALYPGRRSPADAKITTMHRRKRAGMTLVLHATLAVGNNAEGLFVVLVPRQGGVTVVGTDPLTPHEAAQLTLQPAVDAVEDYMKASDAAATHLTQLGVDVEAMTVVVYWVGGRLDQETGAALAEITESTGTPIVVVSTRFSRGEYIAAMDAILATQQGVKSLSAQDGHISVNVETGSPLSGRPSEVAVTGSGATIPVQYQHPVVQPLAPAANRHQTL